MFNPADTMFLYTDFEVYAQTRFSSAIQIWDHWGEPACWTRITLSYGMRVDTVSGSPCENIGSYLGVTVHLECHGGDWCRRSLETSSWRPFWEQWDLSLNKKYTFKCMCSPYNHTVSIATVILKSVLGDLGKCSALSSTSLGVCVCVCCAGNFHVGPQCLLGKYSTPDLNPHPR